jgi:hypothetical protein
VTRRAVLSVLVLVSLTLVAAPTSGSQPGADRGTLVVKP